jgi:hypothetical protein
MKSRVALPCCDCNNMDGSPRDGASQKTIAKQRPTPSLRGLKQLARETEDWERIAGEIGCVLKIAEGG